MAKNNYYAVKVGREPGIYTSWNDCLAQVKNFSGNEYKGFVTKEEAESWLNGENKTDISLSEIGEVDAKYYVDGSYFDNYQVYGYSFYCDPTNGESYTFSGAGNNPDCLEQNNVAGEMIASMNAVKDAIAKGYNNIAIMYDYYGIEHFATGFWQPRTTLTTKYAEYMKSHLDRVGIMFVKVKGHSGIEGNELVDDLAKKACMDFVEKNQ